MADVVGVVRALVERDADLKDAQIFEIGEPIWEFAQDLLMDRLPEDGEGVPHESLPTPLSSLPPSERLILVWGSLAFVLALVEGEVLCACWDRNGLHLVGSYRPGHPCSVKEAHWVEAGPDVCAGLLDLVAFVMAIVNEPRVVIKRPGLTRQQRRAAQRGFGFAVDAWTKVTWDMSKPCAAKTSRNPNFHSMPLHWCRGHFRRADQHFNRAMQRPDAFRPEDRSLWWQWIDGHWRGHPAFGVKRSVHAPLLTTGAFARRREVAA